MGIEETYENLTYFDYYSSSLLLFLLITIVTALSCIYFYLMMRVEPLKKNWAENRCKPYVIPFAGLINKNNNESATEATFNNFNYCTQKILSNSAGKSVQPITYLIAMLSGMVGNMKDDINGARGMIDRIRTSLTNVFQQLMGRIINIIVPFQEILLSFKDMMAKIQGVLITSLFTMLSTYYGLKSMLGVIATLLLKALIAGAAMIIALWIVPFTWPAAIAGTAILVTMSALVAVMLTFLVQMFKIRPELKLPAIPSARCFDKNTLLEMQDGSKKTIDTIKVGDLLKDNNKVTAVLKLDSSGVRMYNLNGTIVSETHKVLHENEWIPVSTYPNASVVPVYTEQVLYCLNTTSKIIYINEMTFIDWDEIYENVRERIARNTSIQKTNEYHKLLDGGLVRDTKILMSDGSTKNIKDVKIGDMLTNKEKVYGVVEIERPTLQFIYYLGNNQRIKGGPNLKFVDLESIILKKQQPPSIIQKRDNKLYHLLTDSGKFTCENIVLHDYNACIDLS
jgi:hypothetical protein